MKERCSCVILNYNDATTTIRLVKNIYNYSHINKIVVVDNKSTDNSKTRLEKITDDKVILICLEQNKGYGAGNNAGVKYIFDNIGDKFALIANPDVDFLDDVLEKMIKVFSKDENIGVIAAKQKDLKGKYIQDIAWKIPSKFELIMMDTRVFRKKIHQNIRYTDMYMNSAEYVDVNCVPGAMLMVDIEKFLEFGGYDENMFLYCEETFLGIRLRKIGYRTVLLSHKNYTHAHSVSIDKSIKSKLTQYKMIVENRIYLMKKYYNANAIEIYLMKMVYGLIVMERKIIVWMKNL